MVLSDRAIALTRRPVKDKGALMQTLHLRLRDLRAISLGPRPDRWPSPSLRAAATWKGALPLPNHPSPTSAVGSRPARSRQRLARCPTVGAGLPLASPLREVRVVGPDGADTNRVCPRQTASDLPPYPAPHEAGDLGTDHWQACASESRWLASGGLSFLLGPRRFRAHSCGEKTADPTAHVGALAGVSRGARACPHHWRGEGAWPATTSP
ncbi:hypothetical protein FIU89_22025 (plasmid) [Roseovarius sp. THAF27]|nr:hypothetical protein FIU89_22025 [Roseovarius sp. THAF27]